MNDNSNIPPNINPGLYAFSATIIASILADNLNPLEQNSFGNWLILIGQFIITNAAQEQLINNRNNSNNYQNNNYDLNFILATIKKIENELENLKNNQ